MNVVAFACGTEFHLLVSYILASSVYTSERKILLLHKNPRLAEYLDRIPQVNTWDEVHVIDPDQSEKSITRQVELLSEAVSILHFFSWGFPPLNKLFQLCHQRDVRIVFTDEGIGTYMPFTRFYAWLAVRPEHAELARGFDIANLDEIWLFEPELYKDKEILPVRQISLHTFFKACSSDHTVVDNYFTLFPRLKNLELNCDIVYFRQYLYIYGYYAENTDAFIDDFVIKLLNNYNFCVKNHPAATSNLYAHGFSNEFEINDPWEAIIIAAKINPNSRIRLPKVLISPTSSGMFKSCAMGIPGAYIFLHKLIERYSAYRDSTIDELIQIHQQKFLASKLYAPESWEEFQTLLEKVAKDYQLSYINGSLDVNLHETAWLMQNTIQTWNTIKKQTDQLVAHKRKVQELTAANHNLEARLRELNDQKQDVEFQLQQIATSKAWKVALALRSLRVMIFPEGSLQFRCLRFLWRQVHH